MRLGIIKMPPAQTSQVFKFCLSLCQHLSNLVAVIVVLIMLMIIMI